MRDGASRSWGEAWETFLKRFWSDFGKKTVSTSLIPLVPFAPPERTSEFLKRCLGPGPFPPPPKRPLKPFKSAQGLDLSPLKTTKNILEMPKPGLGSLWKALTILFKVPRASI